MLKQLLPLSWSRIDAYLRCPRKLYIDRIKGIKQEETPAMLLGKAVHEALEIWVNTKDNNKALEKLDFLEDYETARLRYYSGRSMLKGLNPRATEIKFGLTYDLKPTDFFAEDCFLRGVIDLVTKSDFGLEIYDYKSGWSKPDPRQIFLYALALARNGKDIKKAGYILLASHEIYDYQIGENELESAARIVYKVYNELDQKEAESDFPKNLQSCGYCSFRDECLTEGETIEARLNNAYLQAEKAKEVMKEARAIVKETGQPLQVDENNAYGLSETIKAKIIGRKEEKAENERRICQWLVDNHMEWINISPSLPVLEDMPAEIKALIEWKPSASVTMMPNIKVGG